MISWGFYFFVLFVYRCALSIMAVTSLKNLGDSGIYHKGGRGDKGSLLELVKSEGTLEVTGIRAFGTVLTEYLGAAMNAVTGGNPYLINIGFQSLAFFGLYRLLMALDPVYRKRMALLVLLPSFNLWTSLASKEAIVSFLFCMILARYVEIQREAKPILRASTIAYSLLLALFKPHYGAAVAFLFGVTYVCLHVRQTATAALTIAIASLVPLIFVADKIDDLAQTVARHFRSGGSTLTRDAYFIEQYDVFTKALYGMFQSFFGPTSSEAMMGPLQMATFIESIVLILILLYLIVRRFVRLPVRDVVISGFTIFWILFPSYPFGIMNPGSAIRYRSGYIVFVLFIVIVVMVGSLYREQRREAADTAVPSSQPAA